MTWTTLQLRVVTPLFGGDDPKAGGSPVRVPSIRGVLRYWFRAVAAGHGLLTPAEVWKAEERVFGSTEHPSPIRLRLNGDPAVTPAGLPPDWTGGPTWDVNRFHGARYLLGQGLWSFKTGGLTRPFVAPGEGVKLDLRLSGDETVDQQFLLSVWAWLTYGGLGARTRRGFGQLRCSATSAPLPDPFATVLTTVPGPDDWDALATNAIPAHLRQPDRIGWTGWFDQKPAGDAEEPQFPALTPTWWAGRLLDGQHKRLGDALHAAGTAWRNFRAATADLSATPSQNTRSPEWTGAIHDADTRYPIAALGLPVGYYSKKTKFKTAAEADRPRGDRRESLRRASPVWLRPVRLAAGKWRIFSHVFRAQLLPCDAEIHLTDDGHGKQLDIPDRELTKQAWDAWISQKPRIPRSFYTKPDRQG